MVDNFFKPWGYSLSGEVEWQGEDNNDFGKIMVEDNVITVALGKKRYGKGKVINPK
jgi:hypothetical protein